MHIVGITGGIGSGKSTICKVFEHLGIPVFNADERGKFLLQDSKEVRERVKSMFGDAAYDAKGILDPKYLANIVFKDQEKLKQLNEIIHPAVRKDFLAWKENLKAVPYLIKEAAILIESGSNIDCNTIIVVSADEELRISRVVERDKVKVEQVKSRVEQQLNEKEREGYADYIIDNNGKNLLLPQILKIHEDLISKAGKRS